MRKRLLALLLCLVMVLSLMPTVALAEDTKTEISVIRATSDIMTPVYGAAVKIPNFTITEGAGAYFATNNGGWMPGQLWNGAIFGVADYYYYTQVRIDYENANYYKFSTSLKVYVNGVEWEVSNIQNNDTYSMLWVKSPVTTTTEPVGMPFTVDLPSSYKVAAGGAGTKANVLDFAKYVSGGTKPYTYTKVSGPDWLTLSEDGILSGTRPDTASAATSFVLRIADSKGASEDITVPVGAVNVKTEISVIRATSDIMTPVYGATAKIPNFTITEGNAAWFATNNGGWFPGQLDNSDIFDVADYYYYTQVRIDYENGALYKFSPGLKVYVNDVEWEVESVLNTDTYSMAWVKSPVTTTAEPTETRAVAFNMNGRGTAIDAQTVEIGSKATKPATPTTSGYTFGGWYTDSACTTAFDFNTPITDSIVLYAKWTKNIEAVNKITITAPKPIAGKTRAEAAKIATVTSTPANAIVITDGDWWNLDGNYATTFEAGKTYCYGLYINPKDGYKFEMSGDDYLGEINVTNGVVDCTEANGKGGFFLSVFVECEDNREAIPTLQITVPKPAAGKTRAEADKTATVVSTPAGAVTVSDGDWWYLDGNYMTGCFENGKAYSYGVYINPKDGYKFEMSGDDYLGAINVIGGAIEYTEASGNGIFLSVRVNCVDTRTNITGIDLSIDKQPAAGQTPAECMFVPTVTTDPANAVDINMAWAGWYNHGGNGLVTGTFRPGTEYIYEICLMAKDGYRFPSGNCDDMALANGEAVLYVDVSTNGEYAYIGIAMTPTAPIAPDAPNVKITTSAGHPKLTWDAVDGAAKYWIYRSTDGVNFKYYDSTTKTSYTNSSTTIGTTYYYKVKAVAVRDGENVASELSAAKSVKCVPAAPSISIYRTNGKPQLKWNAVSGATKYWIYRSTDGVNYSYYDSTTKTSYTNSGASSGTTYYYKVKAVAVVNGNNVTSAYSNAKSLLTTLAAPSVSITTSNGKPKLSWSSVKGADKYYIYRSTDGKNFSYYDSTTKTSYTNSGASKNTKYYYKVKAVCSSNSNANSAQSSTVSIKATK